MALQRFGPFELVKRLGVGGMAETFVAMKRGPGAFEQTVCVKRILPAFENDANFVRLFLEEARIAAQLRHANVVSVVDFGAEDGQHYMALELVEGCDLRALLKGLAARGETLTSGLLVFIAVELAQALDFAHSRPEPIVHRDVSPSNVLLSFAGEVKLSDFGIARAIKGNDFTSTAQVKGKVPYMAPEYALSGRVDPRIDLFALGVLLYEALAGRRPFDGTTELDTLRRIESGEHVPLGEIVPTVPKAFVDAIERLISAKADARFATANDFLDALIDVSPPPTARRVLAELVKRVVGDGARRASVPPDPAASVDPIARTAPAATKVLAPHGTHLEPGVVPVPAADPAPAVARSTDPTRTRVEPRGEVARAETAPVAAPASAAVPVGGDTFGPAPEATVKRSSRTPLVLSIVAVLVVASGSLGGWIWWDSQAETRMRVVAPSAAPPTEATVTPVVAPPATPSAPALVEATSIPEIVDAGPAHLSIVAYPFGTVAIDGQRRGRSPVEADVAPGHHVVTCTNGTVVRQRPVDVPAGRRQQVRLNME